MFFFCYNVIVLGFSAAKSYFITRRTNATIAKMNIDFQTTKLVIYDTTCYLCENKIDLHINVFVIYLLHCFNCCVQSFSVQVFF